MVMWQTVVTLKVCTVEPLILAALKFWRLGPLNYFGVLNFGVFNWLN